MCMVQVCWTVTISNEVDAGQREVDARMRYLGAGDDGGVSQTYERRAICGGDASLSHKSIRGRDSGRTGSDGDLARLTQGAPVGTDVALDELGVELCREEPLEVVHRVA